MLLIISGPSGVGKTTITRAVERAFPGSVFSVSDTTRPRTDADQEGVDYHFVSDAQFDRLIAESAFLEWANVFSRRYGTLRAWVEQQLAAGRLVILEIDVQGAINVKRQIPAAFAIFVLPPSEEALLERLRARKREPEDVIQRRFAEARHEIAQAREGGAYNVFLVNDDLDRAVAQAVAVIQAEMDWRKGGRGRQAPTHPTSPR